MCYQVSENDISATVRDFEALCAYIVTNKPLLTKKGNLCTKACFALNSRMTYPKDGANKTDRMDQYETLSLYFLIAAEAGFLVSCQVIGQKSAVTVSEAYEIFAQMNTFSKYLFIFLAWMYWMDVGDLYEDDPLIGRFGATFIDRVFLEFGKHTGANWIFHEKGHNRFSILENPLQELTCCHLSFLYHLRDFGLLMFEDKDVVKKDFYDTFVQKIFITRFGARLSSACDSRKFTWVNEFEDASFYLGDDNDAEIEVYEKDFEQNLPGSDGFLAPFLSCFPESAIDSNALNRLLFPQDDADSSADKIIFEFNVQLDRGCYRVLQCMGTHTFEDLHLAIQESFAFDNEHLYSFFMDGKKWSKRAVNSPYSDEPPFAHEVLIGQAGFRVKQTILYLFDYGDEWMFQVTVASIQEAASPLQHPQIVKSEGNDPEQYPNWD